MRLVNLVFICLLLSICQLFAQEKPLQIIMIGAHPDDCDIKSGGTAALFVAMGHKVKFLSVTNGDAGHMTQGGGMLAKRRLEETNPNFTNGFPGLGATRPKFHQAKRKDWNG
jgi:hypothetical protein